MPPSSVLFLFSACHILFFLYLFGYLGLEGSPIPAKKKRIRKRLGRGTLSTCEKCQGLSLNEHCGHLHFCALKRKDHGLASELLGFSVFLILGVKNDVIRVLSGQVLEYMREPLCKHASGHMEAGRLDFFFLPTVSALLLLTSLKACDWSGHTPSAPTPVLSPSRKNGYCKSLSSAVHCGQHDTKYVTLKLRLHAAVQ